MNGARHNDITTCYILYLYHFDLQESIDIYSSCLMKDEISEKIKNKTELNIVSSSLKSVDTEVLNGCYEEVKRIF